MIARTRTGLYVRPQFRIEIVPRRMGAGVAPAGHRTPLASRQLHWSRVVHAAAADVRRRCFHLPDAIHRRCRRRRHRRCHRRRENNDATATSDDTGLKQDERTGRRASVTLLPDLVPDGLDGLSRERRKQTKCARAHAQYG